MLNRRGRESTCWQSHSANRPGLRDAGQAERLGRALQNRVFRHCDRVRGADMHPEAVEAQPEQPLGFRGLDEQPGQRERTLRRALEQAGEKIAAPA